MRQPILWIVILLFGLGAGVLVGQLIVSYGNPQPEWIAVNDLARLIKDASITAINVQDNGATATTWDGQQYSLHLRQTDNLSTLLSSFGVTPDELATVTYQVDDEPAFGAWLGILAGLLPVVLLGGLLL